MDEDFPALRSLKKGRWEPWEDEVLLGFVAQYGPRNWSAVQASTGLLRSGKSCRLRWKNELHLLLDARQRTLLARRFSLENHSPAASPTPLRQTSTATNNDCYLLGLEVSQKLAQTQVGSVGSSSDTSRLISRCLDHVSLVAEKHSSSEEFSNLDTAAEAVPMEVVAENGSSDVSGVERMLYSDKWNNMPEMSD